MKTVSVLALTLLSLNTSAQTKDTFELKSFPTYDEFGNYYQVVNRYDHVPTTQDSLTFKIESDKSIKRMMDSIRPKFEIKSTPRKKKRKS